MAVKRPTKYDPSTVTSLGDDTPSVHQMTTFAFTSLQVQGPAVAEVKTHDWTNDGRPPTSGRCQASGTGNPDTVRPSLRAVGDGVDGGHLDDTYIAEAVTGE